MSTDRPSAIMRRRAKVIDRGVGLAEIQAFAAHLGVKLGHGARAPFPLFAAIHHNIGVRTKQFQPVLLGQQQLGAQRVGVSVRVERAAADDPLGLFQLRLLRSRPDHQ